MPSLRGSLTAALMLASACSGVPAPRSPTFVGVYEIADDEVLRRIELRADGTFRHLTASVKSDFTVTYTGEWVVDEDDAKGISLSLIRVESDGLPVEPGMIMFPLRIEGDRALFGGRIELTRTRRP
jgi:hypothetical protein